MRVEVCVPGAAEFREATEELEGSAAVTVTRAGVLAGANECVAAYGDSFGNFCDPSVAERLSVRGRCMLRRVKEEILAHYDGELPVGCAVTVTTPHPKRWLLVYAPVVRALAEEPDVGDGIAPYLAMRAVLRAVLQAGMSVSMMLPSRATARSCAQLRHAMASVVGDGGAVRLACISHDPSLAGEDHRALMGRALKYDERSIGL